MSNIENTASKLPNEVRDRVIRLHMNMLRYTFHACYIMSYAQYLTTLQPTESSLDKVPTALSSLNEIPVSLDEASFDEVR